jgi:uncharacterized protein YecT (DUF1311 family)
MNSNDSRAHALRNATQATLLGHAATKEAKSLLAYVYGRVVEDLHKHEATRPNARKLRSAVDAFLADLLVAQSGDRPREWVYRAMNPRGFTGVPVGYRVFLKVVESLKRLKLIEQVGGVNQYVQGFDGDSGNPSAESAKGLVARRYAARFRAVGLLDISIAHGVLPSEAAEHYAFEHRLPKHPLQKRTASKRSPFGRKLRGKVMPCDRTQLSDRLEAEVRELNEFLADQQIEGGIHEGYPMTQGEMNRQAAQEHASALKELGILCSDICKNTKSNEIYDVQVLWSAFKEAEAERQAQRHLGGSIRPMLYSLAATTITKARIKELQQWLENPGD